jgi:hypothetical protein
VYDGDGIEIVGANNDGVPNKAKSKAKRTGTIVDEVPQEP